MSLDTLKKKAKKAAMDGKYDVALLAYIEIHEEEKDDLRIHTKIAEMKEKTGNIKGSVKTYTVIAKAYADQGFVVQAIAINKLIMRLDPTQTEIKEKLRTLSSERGDDWAITTITPQDHLRSLDSSSTNQAKLSFERTPLLSGLAGQELEDFIDSLELKEVSAGDFIYNSTDMGNALYLIGMGSVRLEAQSVRGEKQVFSRLGEGDFFGELAFMSRSAHIDAAIAESDVSLLILNRNVFDGWVKKYPSIHDTVEDFYRRRVLARILAITPVFEGIPAEARVPLAQQFSLSFYRDGDVIIKEGDVENSFCLIRSGRVQVSTQSSVDKVKNIKLSVLGEGSFFGEVSMLTNKPRTATVTAAGRVEVMTLTAEKFNAIAEKFPTVRKIVSAFLMQRVKNTIKTLKDSA